MNAIHAINDNIFWHVNLKWAPVIMILSRSIWLLVLFGLVSVSFGAIVEVCDDIETGEMRSVEMEEPAAVFGRVVGGVDPPITVSGDSIPAATTVSPIHVPADQVLQVIPLHDHEDVDEEAENCLENECVLFIRYSLILACTAGLVFVIAIVVTTVR